MQFHVLNAETWRLSNGIEPSRKKRLLKITFENIIDRIAREAKLIRCRPEKSRRPQGLMRIFITLEVSPEAIDLFHNGAGGYRAQYYVGEVLGLSANRYAVEALRSAIPRIFKPDARKPLLQDVLDKSLFDPTAKIWIHQGIWFRQSRLSDRNLLVERWIENGWNMKLEKQKLPIWARLTPPNENRLQLKGGWLDSNLISVGDVTKPNRARDLHCLGYT